jgi:hypothetical protein
MQIGKPPCPFIALVAALSLATVQCGTEDDRVVEQSANGVMLVLSNPTDPSQDETFNDWYDEHVREVLEVPGVVSATRYVLADKQLPGGEGPTRQYLVIYELRDDDLGEVRDRILASSDSRHHSDSLEMDPLPITSIYRRIRETIEP